MDRALTIEEIAKKAAVSRSTVSRVLNNQPNVSADVRERVLRIIKAYNYAPHAAARSLASRRTHNIGFVFPSDQPNIFHDLFFVTMMRGVMDVANQHDYATVFAVPTPGVANQVYNKLINSHTLDGLVVLASQIDDPLLPQLISKQIPFVLCERHPYLTNVSWVEIDNQALAREAVNHLIAYGHRRIATITGPLNISSGIERQDGYKHALLEHGLPIDSSFIIQGGFTHESGYLAMQRLLHLDEPPTAVFAASDSMAMGAWQAIREAGWRVPNDIALVGFDDLPLGQLGDLGLTTVRQPINEIGAAAASVLIDQLTRSDFTPIHRKINCQLVVRGSSGSHHIAQPA